MNKKIWVLNQGMGENVVDQLTAMTTAGLEVGIVTGRKQTQTIMDANVDYVRAPAYTGKTTLLRATQWMAYTLFVIPFIIRHRKDHFLVTTNPPLVMLCMPILRYALRIQYSLLVLDVYPEAAERLGYLKQNGLLANFWRRINALALFQAKTCITIAACMKKTLEDQMQSRQECPIHISPMWADTKIITPCIPSTNPFLMEHKIQDHFIVSYSGNFGASHGLEQLITTASLLKDDPSILFLLIGDGPSYNALQQKSKKEGLTNIKFLPYQPFNQLRFVLSAADYSFVIVGNGFEGISMPSKCYGLLAAGTPIIGICKPESSLTHLILENDVGVCVEPNKPHELAALIRKLRDSPSLCEGRGLRARILAEEHFSKEHVTKDFTKIMQRTTCCVNKNHEPRIAA